VNLPPVAASLLLQAPASRAGGLRRMLVGLGLGILVLFSASAASSSAAAKTDGAPVDVTAMGSAWATLDGFGATDIGRPMQVVLRRRRRAFVGHDAAPLTEPSSIAVCVQAALPDVVHLIDRLAQAEQSAAGWAARYTAEAARVDALATRNAALADQIANLTSLLTACTGAQSRSPAEAATAAALVVGPPSTAAPPEAGAVLHHGGIGGSTIVRGCGTPHGAYGCRKRHACVYDVSMHGKVNPNFRRTAWRCREQAPLSLARPNGERDDRCVASALGSTARRYCLAPPSTVFIFIYMCAERSGCVQACSRQTLARNGGCCKQPVRAPLRCFAGRAASCGPCCPVYYPGAAM
jgi:hypothetical protein